MEEMDRHIHYIKDQPLRNAGGDNPMCTHDTNRIFPFQESARIGFRSELR